MATATFVHDGGAIDYTPAAAVTAGDVIVRGDAVAIAKLDIAANELGALHTAGVFDVVKESTTDVFLADQPVYWDADAQRASPDKGILMGAALAAAAATHSTVRVRLTQ